MTRPSECPKKTVGPWDHGPARAPHPCPYRAEINDDDVTECECCEACTQECRDDI